MAKNSVFEKLITDFNMGYSVGSQAKFAKKMGVSPQLINYWVQGKTVPSAVNMKKLAVILKKNIKEIQKIFVNNEQKDDTQETSVNSKMILSLMEKQNKIIEEMDKKFETKIELLRKEIQNLSGQKNNEQLS